MKIYEAHFSWDVDEERGSSYLLFPAFRKARKRAVELMLAHREHQKETIERLQLGPDATILSLEVEINAIEVVPINAETLCDILNSSGGCYSRSETLKVTLKLPADKSRVVVLRAPDQQK